MSDASLSDYPHTQVSTDNSCSSIGPEGDLVMMEIQCNFSYTPTVRHGKYTGMLRRWGQASALAIAVQLHL